MITVTVSDILQDVMPMGYYQDVYCIYIARREAQNIYIGKAEHQSAHERLLEHLAATSEQGFRGNTNGPSDLGQLILANIPLSLGWPIDLLTLTDCQQLLVQPGGVRSVDEAERLLIQKYAPILNRTNANEPNLSAKGRQRTARRSSLLPEHALDYLSSVSANSKTQDTYRYALQRFQRFAEAENLTTSGVHLAPNRLPGDVLVSFVHWLTRQGAKNNTIRTFVTVVKQYLAWLQSHGVDIDQKQLQQMVMALEKAAGPHMQNIPHEHRNPDQSIRQLFTYFAQQLRGPYPSSPRGMRRRLSDLRNFAIVQTLYSTAGRASEVASLSRTSIEAPQADERAGRRQVTRPLPVTIVGKGGKPRQVFLTAEALGAITSYLAERDQVSRQINRQPPSIQNEALFVRHDRNSSENISPKSVWQIVSHASEIVFGLDKQGKPKKRFGPRDFRHIRAQELFDRGMQADTLQIVLGHSSLATTLRTYGGRLSQERLATELERFGRNFDEPADVGTTKVPASG